VIDATAAVPAAAAPAPEITPAAAQAELARMMEDRGSPIWDASHAEHGAATQRLHRLSALARGQAAPTEPGPAGVVDGDTNTAMLAAATAADAAPPDRPDGYSLAGVRLAGEGRDEAADRAWMAWAREAAHTAGLNVAQWDGLVAAHGEIGRQELHADGYRGQIDTGLRRVWGADYERNLAGARALVETIERERPGLVEWLEGTGLGNHPTMIRMAADLARKRGLVK